MLRKLKSYHGDTPEDVVSYNAIVRRLEELLNEYGEAVSDADNRAMPMIGSCGCKQIGVGSTDKERTEFFGRYKAIEALLNEVRNQGK